MLISVLPINKMIITKPFMMARRKIVVKNLCDINFAVDCALQFICQHQTNLGRTAQLGQHCTEKPGAILLCVGLPRAARNFYSTANFEYRLCYGVCTAHTCIHTHPHKKKRQKKRKKKKSRKSLLRRLGHCSLIKKN